MRPSIVCPVPVFRALLRAFARDPRPVMLRAGRNAATAEWLLRPFAGSRAGPSSESLFTRITLAPTHPAAPTDDLSPVSDSAAAHLFLGAGDRKGQVWGWTRHGEALLPFDRLTLVGPGMHRLAMRRAEPSTRSIGPVQIWSRTIEALGLDVWRRLVTLRVALVGCGRTGSLMATTLARLGVRDLCLVDPDIVELGNVGEMDGVTLRDVGQLKVDAIGQYLDRTFPHARGSIQPVPFAVTDSRALSALKGCDVVVVAGDNDPVRLVSALVACAQYKVLIDIGSGVMGDLGSAERAVGADVRLLVPGDACLLCLGGLARGEEALADLLALRGPSLRAAASAGPRRSGSLRSLNQIAVGLAVQMLQDLVAERLPGSTWARVEIDQTGRVSVDYPISASHGESCALCSMTGAGDAVL